MKEAVSLHVLCKQEKNSATNLTESKGLKRLDAKENIYESVSWRVKEEHHAGLIGKPFCMHEKKGEKSYFGGIIQDIEMRAIADNDGEVRAVVVFKADLKGKNVPWPPTENPNEFVNIHYG